MMRYTWVLVHRCAGLEIALFAVPPEGCGPFSKRLIELFKKKVLYNRCYEKFQELKKARVRFFRQSRRYLKALRSLLAVPDPRGVLTGSGKPGRDGYISQ